MAKQKFNPQRFVRVDKGDKVSHRWTIRKRKINGIDRWVRIRKVKGKTEMQVLNDYRYGQLMKRIAQQKTHKIEKYGVEMSSFLYPYTETNMPPNDTIIYPSSTKKDGTPKQGAYNIVARFYGAYNGEPFSDKHLSRENFDNAIAIHDAPHSVALYLNEIEKNKGKKSFAIHNTVPFAFPFGLEYIKYYTHKQDFPLVVLTVDKSINDLLKTNGVPKKFHGRWCTRVFKTSPTKSFYKYNDLDGIEERFGMAKWQSSNRAKMNPNRILSEKSTSRSKDKKTGESIVKAEKFKIYQTLPIFEMSQQEQLDIMKKHNIKINPIIEQFNWHGCMWCPYRSPDYYHKLKDQYPKMYEQCDKWRKAGSLRPRKTGEVKPYYWFREEDLSIKKRTRTPELIKVM